VRSRGWGEGRGNVNTWNYGSQNRLFLFDLKIMYYFKLLTTKFYRQGALLAIQLHVEVIRVIDI